MKCPACGKWNRASFPTCQFCGEVLEQTGEAPSWRKTLKDDQRGKHIRGDARPFVRGEECFGAGEIRADTFHGSDLRI